MIEIAELGNVGAGSGWLEGFRGKFEGGAMNDFVNGGDGAGAGA